MFEKIKKIVLDTLIEGEARFQVRQDEARSMFRDPNETPEQVKQRLKEINDMINPKEFARQIELLNSGVTSKGPTYDQIIQDKREKDDQAVMLKKVGIRNEIESWGEKGKNDAVISIVSDALKEKAIGSMTAFREKIFGKPTKDNNNSNSFDLK